jgi:hypothetical protein
MAALSTFLIVGASALSAAQQMSAARKEAKATIKQAEFDADQKARETRYRTARAKSSFLTSGLTLDGTPMSSIMSMYDTGLSDINNITSAANTKSKNILSNSRMSAISSIAKTVGGSFVAPSMDSIGTSMASYLPENSLYSLNKAGFGADAFSALEMQDIRRN